MKIPHPSPALVVGTIALVMATTGGAEAAGVLRIGTNNIRNGAVTQAKLSAGVRAALKADGIATAATRRANSVTDVTVGVPVFTIPAITAKSTNPNPDSGAAGDQGFYNTGNGSGGSATFTDGGLELTGTGIDSNTWQGAIGVAKAYNKTSLSSLTSLSYPYVVDTVCGDQTPTVHVTVTGATNDSKWSATSGFTNLTLAPDLNGVTTVSPGVQYRADGFTQGALWYSTAESSLNSAGGMNNPQPWSYFVKNDPKAVISQISIDNGGTSNASASCTGFDAVVDSLLINNVRYDFGH